MATTQSQATPEDVLFEDAPRPGIGPYRLAWIRLKRNKVALAFGFLFLLIVFACLMAPFYAKHIAHLGPDENRLLGTITKGGKQVNVVSFDGVPIGPTWHGRFFFGADAEGQDVAVRLLYGGRNSLEVGLVATLITVIFATMIGVVAGFYRGWVDGVLTRMLDLIWAYPAVLLGIALGTALALGGISI
ncbi:MAG: peptide/nickel transport system permease protein, partial [Solirubrobacteraceae bacterium]|nr:peptide/nickel transport system permease protein [Solirubrobacteraceae bacterium]